MKKLLVLLVLAGAGGFFAWRQFLRPEKRDCARLEALCGPPQQQERDCDVQLADLRQSLGAEGSSRLDGCIAEAKSCAEASGCVMGAGAGAMGRAVNDFFKGLGKSLSK